MKKSSVIPKNTTTVKELYRNRWISLRQTEDGYTFSNETRCNGVTAAILIVDSRSYPGEVLGRYEVCPAHFDGMALASFTGGVETGNPFATAIHEIKEEAGYEAEINDLVYLGTCRPSKSADTVTHLFAWDARGQLPGPIEGDGSAGEVGAYTGWVTQEEAFKCKDPLMSVLLGRYLLSQKGVV